MNSGLFKSTVHDLNLEYLKSDPDFLAENGISKISKFFIWILYHPRLYSIQEFVFWWRMPSYIVRVSVSITVGIT